MKQNRRELTRSMSLLYHWQQREKERERERQRVSASKRMTNSRREREREGECVRESAAREKLFLCYCENLPPVWHLPLSTTERHHQFSVWLFIVPCSVCVLRSVCVSSLSAVRCPLLGVRCWPPRAFVVRRCSLFVAVRCSSVE